MISQQEFVLSHGDVWAAFETMLADLDRRQRASPEFPALYRQVCQHLALVRDRGYSSHLVARLNGLVLRGHQHLYGARRDSRSWLAHFLAAGFPAAVRAEARLVFIAFGLFVLPAIGIGVAIQVAPETVYTILAPEQAREFEEMYRPGTEHPGREVGRESTGDFMMFGYYIWNNVHIAFQCFASGFLLGAGPVFFLIYNGLLLGAVASHLQHAGVAEQFYSFIIGHGAFELTAIVLAGAAGLRIGSALLFPGRLRRSQALRNAAAKSMPIVYGLTGMLIIAAALEAFWSSSALIPPAAKLAMGAVYWIGVLVYFLTRGRSRAA